MTTRTAPTLLGALLALSLTPAAQAACTYPDTTSVKGSVSGIFYATDGTPTKVKCDLSLHRHSSGAAGFDWGSGCAGLAGYGTGVFMNAAEAQRVVKSSVPQKSCIVSNEYIFGPNSMNFVTIGVATTADAADPTVLLKEKGTLSFTRSDGIFTGKYTVTFPKP